MRRRAGRLHGGRITSDAPDKLWATDPTEAWTRQDGRCAVFALVDHCPGEAWVDAGPRMDRLAAADLLREAIAERFGSVEVGAAAGLKLRHDGSCFRSAHYQAELDHLAIERSRAFHYEPETNVSSRSTSNAQAAATLARGLRHARTAPRPRASVRPRLQPALAARTPPPHAQQPLSAIRPWSPPFSPARPSASSGR